MKELCNLVYSKKDFNIAKYQITRIIDDAISNHSENSIDWAVAQVKEKFRKGSNNKINLSEVENDEDIKSFKELLDNRALSFQTNPNKLNIVKAILNAFFDMNLVGESSDMEEKGPVDLEEVLGEKEVEFKEIARNIYGFYTNVIENVKNDFRKNLYRLLIYDDSRKLNLSVAQMNRRITDYKIQKFDNIVNFLKEQYKDNEEILKQLNSLSLYNDKIFNDSGYYKVIRIFNDFLKTVDRKKLYEAWHANQSGSYRKSQIENWKKVLDFIKNDEDLKVLYNDNLKDLLFQAFDFSNQYYKIKNAILDFEKMSEELSLIFDEIEFPGDNLKTLSVINDFTILTRFDDLLDLSDLGIKLEQDFIANVHPYSIESTKYTIKDNKKHQTSTFGQSENKSSDSHTDTNVKEILKQIPVLVYSDSSKLSLRQMTLVSLLHAWNTFKDDLFNGKLKFSGQWPNEKEHNGSTERYKLTGFSGRDIETIFKRLISTIDVDTTKKVEYLFRNLFDNHLIDQITSRTNLNNLDIDILYSFYKYTLDKNENSGSVFSKENSRIGSTNEFNEISSELVSLLYRNVENSFINTDSRKGDFSIKRKFIWDSSVIDQIETINYKSKMNQMHKSGRNFLMTFGFSDIETEKGTYLTTIKIKDLKGEEHQIGLEYKCGVLNPYGLLTSRGDFKLLNKELLNDLAKVDLIQFADNCLGESQNFNNDNERLLYNLLRFVDNYTNLGILSETGLASLLYYKEHYKEDRDNQLYGTNYLEHFLLLGLRAADVENNAITEGSKYDYLIKLESAKTISDIVVKLLDGSHLIRLINNDQAIDDFVKSSYIITGKSVKSTSLNKFGDLVSNFSVGRLGSEIYRRLDKYRREENNPAGCLLFINTGKNSLTIDPVVDEEITTVNRDVKKVRDMTSGELFYHAAFDKFFNSFIRDGRICFLPTVYSDKTAFLNYLCDLGIFEDGDQVMKLDHSIQDEAILKYKNTFFQAHSRILGNVLDKYRALIRFDLSDPIKELTIDDVRNYLKSKTAELLLQVVDRYNQANSLNKIELELDKDYREKKSGGRKFCDINEILIFYNDLYTDLTNQKLIKYFNLQKQIFVQLLKDNRINLLVFNTKEELDEWINVSKLGEEDTTRYGVILKILSSSKILDSKEKRKEFVDNWIDKNTGTLITDKLSENGETILNPLLEKYFYIEGLASNNMRLLLSGSEINHPDKEYDTTFNKLKSLVSKLNENPNDEDSLSKFKEITGLDYKQDSNVVKILNEGSLNDLKTVLPEVYNDSIISIINTAQGTLYKRNVIIPATLQHLISGKLNGSADEVIVACIKDMQAPVNNLTESDEIDACDGSAKMSSILVILENNSLGSQAVGTNRKPIWDDQTSDLTSFLAKFAAFGQTTSTLLQSLESDSSDYNMFKKMHSIEFDEGTNLTHYIRDSQPNKIDPNFFRKRILQGNKLIYKNKDGKLIEIIDFGRDEDGIYFTRERKYSLLNYTNNPNIKVDTGYIVKHYFDEDSNHSTTGGTRSINTLFELFTALGGVNCVDANGNVSDFIHQALTNFVINCGYTSDGKIHQVLKNKFIAYVFNSTAVKNGAKNMNEASAWTDNSKLRTFNLKIAGLGILLNADHDIVDSTSSEASQVIAACAAYGKMYHNANELYMSLGLTAYEESKEELDSMLQYFVSTDPEEARYKLYRIVGKIIVNSDSNNLFDLTNVIKSEIANEFKNNRNKNNNTELLIPFSDPSLYRQFITALTATINKNSIKRRHPGSPYVMVPGYNMMQYFQIWDDKTHSYRQYMFLDVLKKALTSFRQQLIYILGGEDRVKNFDLSKLILEVRNKNLEITSPYLNSLLTNYDEVSDVTQYNKNLVNIYLQSKQNSKDNIRYKDWFMPTDIVNILNEKGLVISKPIRLDSMSDYYKFKDGLFDIEVEYDVNIEKKSNTEYSIKNSQGEEIVLSRQFSKDTYGDWIITTTTNENLIKAAEQIVGKSFRKNGEIDKIKHMYQLNITKAYNLKPSLIRWQYLNKDGKVRYMNIYDHPIIKNSWNLDKSKRPKQREIQEVLDKLDQGKFVLDGLEIDIIEGSLENTEAEVILGNMYKETFQTGDKSLAEMIDSGEDHFINLEKRKGLITEIPKGQHTVAFIKGNGKHLLISFDKEIKDQNVYKVNFDKETEEKILDPKSNKPTGDYYIKYKGITVGKYVKHNKYKYQEEKKDSDGKIISHEAVYDELDRLLDKNQYKIVKTDSGVEILRRIDYVKKYRKIKLSVLNNKEALTEYDFYQVTQKAPDDIVKQIYGSDNFVDVLLNTDMINGGNTEIIKSKLQQLVEDNDSNNFNNHIKAIIEALDSGEDFSKNYKNEKNKFISDNRYYKKQYSSFLTSLHFISSRIPAQSLQSFMPMKCVAWTQGSNNTAYVSHIQTYLQGSDY